MQASGSSDTRADCPAVGHKIIAMQCFSLSRPEQDAQAWCPGPLKAARVSPA